MRKFITLLTVSILLLCALTSCNLDKDVQCTFSFECVVNIQDEDTMKEMEEYMKTNYVERRNLPTRFGKAYDARVEFIEYFANAIQNADSDYINAHLLQAGDYVSLSGVMSSDYGREWMGTHTWQGQKGESPDNL